MMKESGNDEEVNTFLQALYSFDFIMDWIPASAGMMIERGTVLELLPILLKLHIKHTFI